MKKVKVTNLEYHSVANIFPMMTEAEFSSLKQDISVNGLREPIWLYEGKIIDGRNRYLACIASGVKPIFRNYEGEENALIDFVISLNLHRRHLSSSQKACLAVGVMPQLEDRTKDNFSKKISAIRKGEKSAVLTELNTSQMASKIFSVSEAYIFAAKKLQKESESLFNEVLSGKMTLQQAKKQQIQNEIALKLELSQPIEMPSELELTRREAIRVKEMTVELGVSEAKARDYIVKRRRTPSVTPKEKTTLKEIKFRVYEEDKSELQKKAKEQGKTVAELIRDLLKLNFHR